MVSIFLMEFNIQGKVGEATAVGESAELSGANFRVNGVESVSDFQSKLILCDPTGSRRRNRKRFSKKAIKNKVARHLTQLKSQISYKSGCSVVVDSSDVKFNYVVGDCLHLSNEMVKSKEELCSSERGLVCDLFGSWSNAEEQRDVEGDSLWFGSDLSAEVDFMYGSMVSKALLTKDAVDCVAVGMNEALIISSKRCTIPKQIVDRFVLEAIRNCPLPADVVSFFSLDVRLVDERCLDVCRRWEDFECNNEVILPFTGRNFILTHFPIVEGGPHFCVSCSRFVFACPHLVFDSVRRLGAVEMDFSQLVSFLYKSLWKRSSFVGNRPKFTWDEPYTRFVFAEAYSALVDFDKFLPWKNLELRLCIEKYGCRFEPQVFITKESMMNRLNNIVGKISFFFDSNTPDVIKKVFGTAFSFVEMISGVFSKCAVKSLGAFQQFMFGVVWTSVREKVSQACSAVSESKYCDAIMLILKVFVRYGFGYTAGQQILELVLDRSIHSFIKKVPELINYTLPQLGDETLSYSYLFSVIFLAIANVVGIFSPSVGVSTRLFDQVCRSVAGFDRAGIWSKMIALKGLVFGDSHRAFFESLAGTPAEPALNFYNVFCDVNHSLMVEKKEVTLSQKQALGAAYHAYLKCARAIPRTDIGQITAYLRPAVDFIRNNSINAYPRFRACPDVFMFHGQSGLGKSTIIQTIADEIHLTEHKNDRVTESTYHINPSDAYFSGYESQDVIVFDEFMQEKDGDTLPAQSASVSNIFKICTTSPTMLNMAAVEDKGKYLKCSLVMGATNIALHRRDALETAVKSVVFPRAFSSRITYRVNPRLKKGFVISDRKICRVGADGTIISVCTEQVDPQELYDFTITDTNAQPHSRENLLGPNVREPGGRVFSFEELMVIIYKSYRTTKEFKPEVANGRLATVWREFEDKAAYKGFSAKVEDLLSAYVARFEEDRVESLRAVEKAFDKKQLLASVKGVRKYLAELKDSDLPTTEEFNDEINRRLAESDVAEGKRECEAQGWFQKFVPPMWRTPELVEGPALIQTYRIVDDKLEKAREVELHCLQDFEKDGYVECLISAQDKHLYNCPSCGGVYVNAEGKLEDFTDDVTHYRVYVAVPTDWSATSIVVGVLGVLAVAFGARYAYLRYDERDTPLEVTQDEVITEGEVDFVRKFDVESASSEGKVHHEKQVSKSSSGQSSPWATLGNERGYQMSLTIAKQLCCVVNNSKAQIGNGLFLDCKTLLVPTHVMQSLRTLNLVYVVGENPIVRSFNKTSYDVRVFTDEVSVIRFNTAIQGMANISGKFAKSVGESVECVRMMRNERGELSMETLLGERTSVGVHYPNTGGTGGEFQLPPEVLRVGRGDTFAGMSGSVYVRLSQVEREPTQGGSVFGFHIAGQTMISKWIARIILRKDVVKIVGAMPAPIEANSKGRFGQMGIIACKTDKIPLMHKAVLGQTRIPYDGEFRPALLFPAICKGVDVSPLDRYTQALRALSKPVLVPTDLRKYSNIVVMEILKKLKPFDEHERTLENAVGGLFDLGPIDRSASPGVPFKFVSPSKGGFCMLDEDCETFGLKPISPNTTLLSHLRALRGKLIEGTEDVPRALGAIKEELRSVKKVSEGNTRLYTVYPLDLNILIRQAFMRSLMFTTQGYRVGSGQFDLDKHLFDAFEFMMSEVTQKTGFKVVHLDGDHVNFDLHCNDAILWEVGYILRCIEKGQVLDVDNRYGIDEEDSFRIVLMGHIINYLLHVGDELIQPPGHPSGSAITGLINFMANLLNLTRAIYKMFGDNTQAFRFGKLLQGDDSDIVISYSPKIVPDMEAFNKSVRDCGFEMTCGDKSGLPVLGPVFDPKVEKRSQYTFCSRYFARNGGLLAPDRLERILPFQNRGSERSVIAQCLDVVRIHLQQWDDAGLSYEVESTWRQVEYCGFSREEFLGLTSAETASRFFKRFDECKENFLAVVPVYNTMPGVAFDFENAESAVAQGLGCGPESGECDETFVQEVPLDEKKKPCTSDSFVESHMATTQLIREEALSRPYKVDNFATGTTFATKTYLAPSAFFSNNLFAQLKLFNVAFLRCTTVMRVIASGSPFVYGRVLCGFCPYRNLPTNVQEAHGYPSVEIDLSASNQVELRFPVCTPQNWLLVNGITSFATYNQLFDYGRFFILPMTTLGESVNISVFMWLEDVKARGPSIGAFTLSQGKSAKYNRGDDAEEKWLREHTPDWVAAGEATVASIGRSIERLGYAVTGPLKEASDSGATAIFSGFCANPASLVSQTVSNMTINSSQIFSNAQTVVMGCSQVTQLVPPPDLFCAKRDEMEIIEMVKMWQYLSKVSWSGASPAGPIIHFQVRPDYYETASVGFPATAYVTRLCYLSTMFNFWRGGLRFKLSIPKTNFQTGVLEIVYQSGTATVDVTSSKQATALPRILWDVATSNTMEFDVPYCAATAWLTTMPSRFDGGVVARPEATGGGININIINPLVDTSGLLPNPVDILIYIAAMPDFEFSVPMINPNVSYPSWVNSVGLDGPQHEFDYAEVEAQGAGDLFVNEKVEHAQPLILASESDLYSHLTTTGERYLNLRPLTRRLGNIVANSSFNGTRTFADVVNNNAWVSTIGLLYAYYVGGWRMCSLINHSSDLYVNFKSVLCGTTNTNMPFHIVPNPFVTSNASAIPDITVPYQHICSFLPVLRYGSEYPNVNSILEQRTSAAVGQRMYGVGDDFTFGWLVGAPQIIFASTVAYENKRYF